MRKLPKIRMALMALCLAFSLSAQAEPEIRKDMKAMKITLSDAMDSDTIEAFAQKFAEFEHAFAHAAAQRLEGSDSDRLTYQDGVEELNAAIRQVHAAINQRNLAAAKNAAEAMNVTKRRYHRALEVY